MIQDLHIFFRQPLLKSTLGSLYGVPDYFDGRNRENIGWESGKIYEKKILSTTYASGVKFIFLHQIEMLSDLIDKRG